MIGGVTIDTIRLPGSSERRTAPGGAGLYTALGAAAAGGRVRLFSQRPDSMPVILSPLDAVLDWTGPVIPLDRLPRLDIIHHGGGRAELAAADWGAQLDLDPADLPPDLSGFQIAHVAALGPTAKQIAFARACRKRGASLVSSGTYGRAVYGDGQAVRELMGLADYFCMNENEAVGLFGSVEGVRAGAGQVVFVTLGERGAVAVDGSGERLAAAALPAAEVDPTGAGDTFCGAVLAVLARGGRVGEAMEMGAALAAATIGELGPAGLVRRISS